MTTTPGTIDATSAGGAMQRTQAARTPAWLALMVILAAGSAAPVCAEPRAASGSGCRDTGQAAQLFTATLGDFRNLATRDSALIAAVGGAAALGAHSVDTEVRRSFSNDPSFGSTFKSGAVIGGTPFQLGAS